MSQLGQTEKNSVRANVFRVTPESGRRSMQSACLKGANFGLLHRSNQIRSPPRCTRAALPALRGAQHLRRIDPSASSTAAPEVGTAPGVRYPARGGDPLL